MDQTTVGPSVPTTPSIPVGRRYTVEELLHLGENLPYLFCYVSAFKTPAFEYGVFRPGVNNKDKARRPRANSMTCNTKGLARPSFLNEFRTEEQIIAASKSFEEEEFKKMLSDDALKAWNSGPSRLAHPRSGDKALAAFKSLPSTVKNVKDSRATAAGGGAAPSYAATEVGHTPKKPSISKATSTEISPTSTGTPTTPNTLHSVAQGQHAARAKSLSSQPMQINDAISAAAARNTANLQRLNIAENMYGTGPPPIAALMDPRALPGLFGRQVAYVRPDPYSQAHFYAPTSMAPHQYTQPAMGMMEDVQWMAVNAIGSGQQQPISMGTANLGGPAHIQTTAATYPNVPYQTWYLRELDREAERLSLGSGINRSAPGEERDPQTGRRRI